MEQESLLRLPEVEQRTGLKRSAIYRRIEAGEFPRPIQLTPRAVAWLSSEVAAWIAAKISTNRSSVQLSLPSIEPEGGNTHG